MIRVNLLPHRQLKREAKQREFNLMAVFSALAAVVAVFLGNTFINSKIEAQVERNQRLETETAKLDQEIADIKDLKTQIKVMLERKQVVENLQTNRNQTVVILDELSRQLPDGMFFKSIKQQGNTVVLEGVTDTNARVATMVRNLSNSNWLTAPSLVEIKTVSNSDIKQHVFMLNATIKQHALESTEAVAMQAKTH